MAKPELKPVKPEPKTNGERPPSVLRLATLVKKARERKGWSQETLAETLHVAHDTIYRLESGHTDPTFSLVANLVRVLNISIENAIFNQRTAKQVGREEQHV